MQLRKPMHWMISSRQYLQGKTNWAFQRQFHTSVAVKKTSYSISVLIHKTSQTNSVNWNLIKQQGMTIWHLAVFWWKWVMTLPCQLLWYSASHWILDKSHKIGELRILLHCSTMAKDLKLTVGLWAWPVRLCKIVESVLRDKLVLHSEKYDLLQPSQQRSRSFILVLIDFSYTTSYRFLIVTYATGRTV